MCQHGVTGEPPGCALDHQNGPQPGGCARGDCPPPVLPPPPGDVGASEQRPRPASVPVHSAAMCGLGVRSLTGVLPGYVKFRAEASEGQYSAAWIS